MTDNTDWYPVAGVEILRHRARMLQKLRAFFSARDVLEVETPILSQAGITDPNIDSFMVNDMVTDWQGYLHTSPEFAMKRLLAAGYGSIYQVCKVFRCHEQGARHNPEFSMLEWYRTGFDYHHLMQEVNELVRLLLDGIVPLQASKFVSYQAIFEKTLSINPHQASVKDLVAVAREGGIDEVVGLSGDEYERDSWLELLMSQLIEPVLPEQCPVFIFDFPASQASLAKIRLDKNPVAERFELFINGMELANGFHELTDTGEQRQRFEKDNHRRYQQGKPRMPIDENLLAALKHGLPHCSGVALGLDRLLMLICGLDRIEQVLSFPFER